MKQQSLNLRDIQLPEPISWWPIAHGWWLLLALTVIIIIALYASIKIYRARQLKRDIGVELVKIKQQFLQSNNKTQLVKALSVLLRRASISYYPKTNIAGLTGEDWLQWLDSRNHKAGVQFQSNTGKILLSAPYLPQHADLDYDANALINLCENWLLGSHKPTSSQSSSAQTQPLQPSS